MSSDNKQGEKRFPVFYLPALRFFTAVVTLPRIIATPVALPIKHNTNVVRSDEKEQPGGSEY
jgi:hypothetical protein